MPLPEKRPLSHSGKRPLSLACFGFGFYWAWLWVLGTSPIPALFPAGRTSTELLVIFTVTSAVSTLVMFSGAVFSKRLSSSVGRHILVTGACLFGLAGTVLLALYRGNPAGDWSALVAISLGKGVSQACFNLLWCRLYSSVGIKRAGLYMSGSITIGALFYLAVINMQPVFALISTLLLLIVATGVYVLAERDCVAEVGCDQEARADIEAELDQKACPIVEARQGQEVGLVIGTGRNRGAKVSAEPEFGQEAVTGAGAGPVPEPFCKAGTGGAAPAKAAAFLFFLFWRLFLGIGIYAVAFAFFNSTLFMPNRGETLLIFFLSLLFVAILGVFISLIIIMVPRRFDLVFVYRLAFPLMAVGFLLIPLLGAEKGSLANIFVMVGFTVFDILTWLILASVSERLQISPYAVFGFGRGIHFFGLFVGSLAAMLCMNSEEGFQELFMPLSLLMVFMLIVASTLVLTEAELFGKGFLSFARSTRPENDGQKAGRTGGSGGVHRAGRASRTDALDVACSTEETTDFTGVDDARVANGVDGTGKAGNIDGVDGASGAGGEACGTDALSKTDGSYAAGRANAVGGADGSQKRARWRERCEAVAKEYDLSPREEEVFILLAKGRDTIFIQSELGISNHTVRSHVYHIYQKLNVHSRQELLDFIEDSRSDRMV